MNDADSTITYSELCQISGLSGDNVISIVEYEIVLPRAGSEVTHWTFDIASIHWIKRAVRLQQDFQIDWMAVALVIDLLRQKEALEKENAMFQRQLDRFLKVEFR